MRHLLRQSAYAFVVCFLVTTWYFYSASSPKSKTSSSRSTHQRHSASVNQSEPSIAKALTQDQPESVSNRSDKTVSLETLQQNFVGANSNTKRDGYEWAYTLGNSMGIEATAVAELQAEAEAKVNNGSLQPQDVEDFLRQRLDEYEWSHHEADISNDDPDWVALN